MILTGCAYYPEHWPEERWALDAQTMREAGIRVVRLAEFAWDKLEPYPTMYNFEWLDRAIETLASVGLQLVLCTPTPTPPLWLTLTHPDINRVREDGVRVGSGGRRHPCANNPHYLIAAEAISDEISRRYGQHPAVIGWQIDNEFGCGETTRCYCTHCAAAFRDWLIHQYQDLDTLNAVWGTQFWGRSLTSWDQVYVPGVVTEPHSPAMLLDYRRFASNSWEAFLAEQAAIVRTNAPGRFITHNLMVNHWSLDYWRLASELDFVSYDNYPHGTRGPAETSMNLDLMRGLGHGDPFWIMEQQPGRVNWHPYNPPVPEGQVRVWSHQAVAHGASTVVYFRYRAVTMGQEQYHAGLLKWDGSKDHAFHEAQATERDYHDTPLLLRPRAKTGIFFDYNDLWALEIEPVQREFRYWDVVYDLYHAHWETNTPIDFLPRAAGHYEGLLEDLKPYETLIVPAAFLVDNLEFDIWGRWVEQGGRLVITFRSGVRTQGNRATINPLPSGLTTLTGVSIKAFMSVPPTSYTAWHRPGSRIEGRGGQHAYKIWAEVLEPTTADTLYTYADGLIAGAPAITVNFMGQGAVFMLGCWVEDMGALLREMGLVVNEPSAVQLTQLRGDDDSWWQVSINHHMEAVGDMPPLGAKVERLG